MATIQNPISNDTTDLIPKTTYNVPVLSFDFPGVYIGIAEYEEGPTGCTVFYFPDGVTTAIDIRGGAVGAMETRYDWYQAICFAGGSLYGLEAAVGVRAELLAKRNYTVQQYSFPTVSGAVIGDWHGREEHCTIYPDKVLGRAALEAARPGIFPLGLCGAGIGARVGSWLCGWGYDNETSGQGAAYYQQGEGKVAVFTVVNASGPIHNRQGQVVRGMRHIETGQRHRVDEAVPLDLNQNNIVNPSSEKQNTTLTLVMMNMKIPYHELKQIATQVHTSMARAIYPFHTQADGDILYAVTTNEVDIPANSYNAAGWGWVAGEVAWEAVLSVSRAAEVMD